jgi:signal peptidase I
MVPVKDVVGRAVVVAWPINRWDTLPVPDTFDQSGLNAQPNAAGLPVAPQGIALLGVVPVVLWRRRKQ